MAGYKYGGTDFTVTAPQKYTIGVKRHVPKCGTRSGYVAHRKALEDACRPCKDANNEYNTHYEARRRARAIVKGWSADQCGTLAGYKSHYRHAVPVCEPCRIANSDYSKAYREARKAAS